MVWKLFLWSSLRKSYSICLESSDLAKFWPFKTKICAFFGQNWLFWEFLTYNFPTQLWIFLIFGMELLWILTLSGNQSYCVLFNIQSWKKPLCYIISKHEVKFAKFSIVLYFLLFSNLQINKTQYDWFPGKIQNQRVKNPYQK